MTNITNIIYNFNMGTPSAAQQQKTPTDKRMDRKMTNPMYETPELTQMSNTQVKKTHTEKQTLEAERFPQTRKGSEASEHTIHKKRPKTGSQQIDKRIDI